MINGDNFAEAFAALTGFKPLSWQLRLHDRLASGDPPATIALPTGLGKTMVMAIWLIARAAKFDVPTRLIYVVDRRTVVDQATDLAKKLRDKCKEALGIDPPAISTLRGQLADNREWSRDLSRAAIIIGTVDLIGSALLFSGYRSSCRRRPLEAGLLGRDALLVLDEAHLSRPFEKLLGEIQAFQSCGGNDADGDGIPLRVICMSATSGDGKNGEPFKLEKSDLVDGEIDRRFTAKKTLTIKLLDKGKLAETLAAEAINLAEDNSLRGSRIVVFVRRPDDARAISDAICKYGATKNCPGPYAKSVEVLTGTMRGLERDELVEKIVLKRFLDGDEKPAKVDKQAVFLISTSAGEVGFDLNADHMVCDAAPIDSLIQRLGRVNRRGTGEATVVLVREPVKMKDDKPAELEGIELAVANTFKLLDGVTDVSPQNLELKRTEWKDEYNGACSPEPATVELTDILLDNWSMTTITEPMPGRPPIAPWLRGIAEWEPPQTTIAWRAELGIDGFADLNIADVEEWFDSHRILTHETLTVKTGDAAGWFKDRWAALSAAQKSELQQCPVIIDRAGMEMVLLGEVVERLSRKVPDADAFFREAAVIVPASFGGIRRGVGLLDPTEPKRENSEEQERLEEQKSTLQTQLSDSDVADVRGRYREKLVKLKDGGEESTPLVPGADRPPKQKYAHSRLELEAEDDKTIQLVSHVPRFERLESGQKRQTLAEHVCAVRRAMDDVLARIALPDEFKCAAQLAADWHDHGKNRTFFQRAIGGTPTANIEEWRAQAFLDGDGKHQCLGKSGGEDRRKPPRGYRHEFGSLRELTDAFKAKNLRDESGQPISQEVFDLAMHLIAAHHGRARPHFPKGGFDPDSDSRSDEIHAESIRRFARLQRKYGWWRLAWLESLLRCADALASADPDSEDAAGRKEGAGQ